MKTLANLPISICLLPTCIALAAPETAILDRFGNIGAVVYQGEQLDLRGQLRIPVRGWGKMSDPSQTRDGKTSAEKDVSTFQGRIEVSTGAWLRYQQTVQQHQGSVTIDIQCTSESDLNIEGVYYWMEVPIVGFAGGQVTLMQQQSIVKQATLPKERPQQRHLFNLQGSEVRLSDVAGNVTVQCALSRTCPVGVQDTREWNGADYDIYVAVHQGVMKQGDSAQLRLQLQVTGQPDTSPATLKLDASKVRYQLAGFGGNYCFGIESPVTQYTLENLRVAWARTEMTLEEWDPDNDNDSPDDTNWEVLQQRDQAGSNLRREFELAAQLQKLGIPYCISIWQLPQWLYADPGQSPRGRPRHIAADKWPELLECLGSYLLHARRQYGVEPDLFSFNEANIGVDVLLTAEEHRDAIKRIGSHFERLGLRTRMLLADATGPRDTHKYALPAAADPEALKYCGAVGFHSWGGGSAKQYAAWGDLAERLNLPLLVTELGVDAAAWRNSSYRTYAYAIREMQMYQELLLYARPQGTMQWEFTSDYSIVSEQKNSDGTSQLAPTPRFWLVKHFCNLTPPDARALTTESDCDRVLLTAFSGNPAGNETITLHISNSGPARQATITGVPAQHVQLRAIRTSETGSFEQLDPVTVKGGTIGLQLSSRSLLTLTSLPQSEQE